MATRMHEADTYKIRRAAIATIGAVGLLWTINHKSDSHVRQHFDAIEQSAMQGGAIEPNMVVIARAGTILRTAPHIANPMVDGAGPDTANSRVADGQVLRIDRPLSYEDESGRIWYGFDKKGGLHTDAQPEEVLWIDYTDLSNETNEGSPFVERYAYDESHQRPLGPDDPVAVGSLIPEDAFKNLAQLEHLTTFVG